MVAIYSDSNTITRNHIKNNEGEGILIEPNCQMNNITHNTIFNNSGYGINISSGSNNNLVEWNTFLHNKNDEIQAYDAGTGNDFAFNHWNDHNLTDTDLDGFTDNPYAILPNSNTDDSPRIAPIWINENSDFADFTTEGNGALQNPYILEGYQFTSSQSNLIKIINTTAYFVIQNC